jgi:hypothetical protein
VLVRLPVADALSSPENCKADLTVFGEDGRKSTRCLEGSDYGGADQHKCRSGSVSVCPSVAMSSPGSLLDRARNGHTCGQVFRLLRRRLPLG